MEDKNEVSEDICEEIIRKLKYLDDFTYSAMEPDPEGAYLIFECQFELLNSISQFPFPEVCNIILFKMTGDAAQMTTHLIDQKFADLDEFFGVLRTIFLGYNFKEKMRIRLKRRIQAPDESILMYYNDLRYIWGEAYPEKERTGKEELFLVSRFVTGLRDPRLAQRDMHIFLHKTADEARDIILGRNADLADLALRN